MCRQLQRPRADETGCIEYGGRGGGICNGHVTREFLTYLFLATTLHNGDGSSQAFCPSATVEASVDGSGGFARTEGASWVSGRRKLDEPASSDVNRCGIIVIDGGCVC